MVTVRTTCRMCSSKRLHKVIDLGDQPLANRFLKREELGSQEYRCPLEVYWCEQCSLAQLIHVVDKAELYRNYIYFSSGMPKLSDHFQRYATDVMRRFLKPGDLVVEIASNDGILLKAFQAQGYKVLGIEPALNIAAQANKAGVNTVAEFFSMQVAADVAAQTGKPKAILSNNVVAHIDDHHDLARGIKALLAPGGAWVIEAPHLLDMFENLAYDTIYHEHLSYLAIRPMISWLGQYGLELFDVEINPVQGQSLRAFVGHEGEHEVTPRVAELVAREKALGMDKQSAYDALAARIEKCKRSVVGLLRDLKMNGKRIAAYGAPAKGNTLLNYCGIGTDLLDFALEDLPSKQDMYTPGQHIPTHGREYTNSHLPDYFLLLAWNYEKVILEKEAEFRRNGGKFIIPIGDEIRVA